MASDAKTVLKKSEVVFINNDWVRHSLNTGNADLKPNGEPLHCVSAQIKSKSPSLS